MDDVRAEWAIGERVKLFRNAALMTQDDLAAAAGVSTGLIRQGRFVDAERVAAATAAEIQSAGNASTA